MVNKPQKAKNRLWKRMWLPFRSTGTCPLELWVPILYSVPFSGQPLPRQIWYLIYSIKVIQLLAINYFIFIF